MNLPAGGNTPWRKAMKLGPPAAVKMPVLIVTLQVRPDQPKRGHRAPWPLRASGRTRSPESVRGLRLIRTGPPPASRVCPFAVDWG